MTGSNGLTQKEVDELLLGSSAPRPVAVVEAVPYSFGRPRQLPRERLALLEAVFSRFALALRALLTARLRISTDVTVRSIEQATLAEAALSLGTPCAAFSFSIGAGASHGAIDFGTELALHCLDRLFGGPGEPGHHRRPLTTIEQGVVRGIATRTLALLTGALQEHIALSFEAESFESDPEMLRIGNPDDRAIIVLFDVHVGAGEGVMTLALPTACLQSLFREAKTAATPGVRPEAHRSAIATRLNLARLGISARLPVVRLQARDVATLAPGQTLLTGQSGDGWVELHVNGRLRFRGTLGQSRRNLGVLITEVVHSPLPERPEAARIGRIQ